MTRILALPILAFFMAATVEAKETRYLMTSPKALLMGNAYTAAVDDEYTLFYNPAAINRTFGVYITPINPQLGATNALDDMDRFKDMPKDAAGVSDRLMGYPVYVQAGVAPGIRFGPIALSLIANTSTSLVLRNPVFPTLDVDYRYDRGFVMGYAYTLGPSVKKKPSNKKSAPAGTRTSFGISVKSITREGIADSFSLLSPELLNQINNSGDVNDIKKALGYSKGHGWGGDLGFEHALVKGGTELGLAFSVLDVGDTRFNKKEGSGNIPVQEMSMNAGVVFKQDFWLFNYALSVDLKPLNSPVSFARKFHVGAQVGLPLVRGYAGFSEGYVSYGVGVRLWPIEVIAGFYSTELGTSYREQEGKRAVIYVSLLDFAFDIK